MRTETKRKEDRIVIFKIMMRCSNTKVFDDVLGRIERWNDKNWKAKS